MIAGSVGRPLAAAALAACATVGTLPSASSSSSVGGTDAGGASLRRDDAPPRPADDIVDGGAVRRLESVILDARRRARVRRGLPAEEDEAERRARTMKRRRLQRRKRKERERERRRSLVGGEEEQEGGREGGGGGGRRLLPLGDGGVGVDDAGGGGGGGGGEQRALQTGGLTGFASGFLLSGASPGFVSENPEDDDVFYVAGISNNNTRGIPDRKDPIVLRDIFRYFEEEEIDPDDPSAAVEIFWEIDIIGNSMQELKLPSVGDISYDWYLEVKKQKKGKKLYIDHFNNRDMNQVWDLRPGGEDLTLSMTGEFFDRTWRAGLQYDKPQHCVEPVFTNGTTLQELDPLQLQKCSNDEERRRNQVWVFCTDSNFCETRTVDPPEFDIEVTCEPQAEPEERDCDGMARTVSDDLEDGRAVDRGLWFDLDECVDDPDPDKTFGKSFAYRFEPNDDEDGIELELNYGRGSCDEDDADAYLRVYKEKSNGDWDCVFVGSTDCDGDENDIVAEVTENDDDDRDFLVIVSSDGTSDDVQDFELTYRCDSVGDTTATTTTPRTDPDDPLYCFADVTRNVEDSTSTPDEFEDLRTPCAFEEEDLDDDQTMRESTFEFVDARGIDAEVTVTSRCDNDGDDFGLETLIRVYRILEDDGDVDEYDCIASAILDCAQDDRPDIDVDLEGGSRYLIAATGATVAEDCETGDFACR